MEKEPCVLLLFLWTTSYFLQHAISRLRTGIPPPNGEDERVRVTGGDVKGGVL